MALTKLTLKSEDSILRKAKDFEYTFARIAHVNEVLNKVSSSVKTVGVLPASTNLTGSTVAPLRDEVEARLDAIESKLNALILALS
jgi:hypothetical protein